MLQLFYAKFLAMLWVHAPMHPSLHLMFCDIYYAEGAGLFTCFFLKKTQPQRLARISCNNPCYTHHIACFFVRAETIKMHVRTPRAWQIACYVLWSARQHSMQNALGARHIA